MTTIKEENGELVTYATEGGYSGMVKDFDYYYYLSIKGVKTLIHNKNAPGHETGTISKPPTEEKAKTREI